MGAGLVHLIAATISLPSASTVQDALRKRPVAAADAQKAADDLARADSWASEGEFPEYRTWLRLLAVNKAPDKATSDAMRVVAEKEMIASLRQAPGQPLTWFYLADLRLRRGDTPGALAAFRMSLLSGAFNPSLMAARTRFGFTIAGLMDAETMRLFERHVRQTWVIDREVIMAYTAQPDAWAIIRRSLVSLSNSEIERAHRIHGRPPP